MTEQTNNIETKVGKKKNFFTRNASGIVPLLITYSIMFAGAIVYNNTGSRKSDNFSEVKELDSAYFAKQKSIDDAYDFKKDSISNVYYVTLDSLKKSYDLQSNLLEARHNFEKDSTKLYVKTARGN